ncbi:MAG: hypothetical protein H6732_11885 [Alphaproteobacteria bacterium]|nr:hypothetical protein [Alphaproteobacteria bacterium]
MTALARLAEADEALQAQGTLPVGLGDLAPVVAGTVEALAPGDWWVPGPRERAGAVLRGVAIERLGDGLDGARPYRVAPVSTAPALRALHAVGLAVGQPDGAAVVHLGVGALADGALAEAFTLAALHGARVVFVLAWRPLDGAPVAVQSAADPVALAQLHGVRTVEVDTPALDAVRDAVAAARAADGPTLVLVRFPRRT